MASESKATAFDTSELGQLDAVETAARIRAGDLKAEEVVAAAVERARALEPALNAVPTETYAAALGRTGRPLSGPFAGVPTFVKGLDDVAGVVNDHGSRAYAGHVPARTEPFVEAFLATGLVSLGKSAAPESGLTGTTEPLAHGPTRNPWRLSHTPGGSSGGAGALVAARVVPLAHGSDGGGSIRIPASFCGLVGLKPSRERRFAPGVGEWLPVRLLTYGALTRSVRDTAHLIAALEDRIRPRKLPPVGRVEGPARERLRIGLFTGSPLGTPVDPEVRDAVLVAGRTCADLGHAVEEIRCPFEAGLLEDFWIFWAFLGWGFLTQTRWLKRRAFDPTELEPWTHGLSDRFKSHLAQALPAVRRLRGASRTSARLFSKLDLLLCPTTATPPPELGYLGPELPFETALERVQSTFCFTPIQNATGDPAISLPLGRSRSGLPIGVQFAAPHGGEARLLALAYELEAAGAFRNAADGGATPPPS
jgi:amidase